MESNERVNNNIDVQNKKQIFDLLLKQYDFSFQYVNKVADLLWKRFSIYFTLNSALTIFISLITFLTDENIIFDDLFRIIFSSLILLFGMVINISWLLTIYNGKLNIDHWTGLTREVEDKLQENIGALDIFKLFTHGKSLKDKRKNHFDYKIQNIALLVPIAFICLWIALILLFYNFGFK